MKVSSLLLVIVLAAAASVSCSKALIVPGTGPESNLKDSAKAEVTIRSFGSSGTSGYYYYTIANKGETDLNLVSFDVTYLVDQTPNDTTDNMYKSYPITITHTGKIAKGGHFSSQGDIQLNQIDSKILTKDNVTFSKREVPKTITFEDTGPLNPGGEVITKPETPTVVTRYYTAYANDLTVAITNNSSMDINEMRIDILVKAKTKQYYIASDSAKSIQSKDQPEASIICSYNITNIPKHSTITKTYKNIAIELDTLTEQEKEHAVYTIYGIEVIDKKILSPGAVYEELKSVTVSDKVTVE